MLYFAHAVKSASSRMQLEATCLEEIKSWAGTGLVDVFLCERTVVFSLGFPCSSRKEAVHTWHVSVLLRTHPRLYCSFQCNREVGIHHQFPWTAHLTYTSKLRFLLWFKIERRVKICPHLWFCVGNIYFHSVPINGWFSWLMTLLKCSIICSEPLWCDKPIPGVWGHTYIII